mmetsp:Transcript_21831/g.60788  ORF Transcript_21831/g.60788 Transcript_21831/m.60788 type:complete len:302 (-) Transcript_21831:63-968(-)
MDQGLPEQSIIYRSIHSTAAGKITRGTFWWLHPKELLSILEATIFVVCQQLLTDLDVPRGDYVGQSRVWSTHIHHVGFVRVPPRIDQRRIIHHGVQRGPQFGLLVFQVVRPIIQHLARELPRHVDQEYAILLGTLERAFVQIRPHHRALRYALLGIDAALHHGIDVDVDWHVKAIAVEGTRRRFMLHDGSVHLAHRDPIVMRGNVEDVLSELLVAMEQVVKVVTCAVRGVDDEGLGDRRRCQALAGDVAHHGGHGEGHDPSQRAVAPASLGHGLSIALRCAGCASPPHGVCLVLHKLSGMH